jgi:purine-binding chemotaxis protein CheW
MSRSMSTTANARVGTEEQEYCTFQVGDLLLGVDIQQVEEINRHLDLTPVPHAPACVRGVVNLRGEVVTAVDLRTVLGLPPAAFTKSTRNVVLDSHGEQIGLLVDRIGDVVRLVGDDVEPLPANFSGADARFFKGVYQLDEQLLVLLDLEAALAVPATAR